MVYDSIIDAFNKMQESYSNNENQWIQTSETTKLVEGTDVNYDSFFDLIAKILQVIPIELYEDSAVNIFINEFTHAASSIITYALINNVLWNVDLIDKFVWIALMLATKTSQCVIPHIGKLIANTEYVFMHEDNNGNTCITLGCWYLSSLPELLKIAPAGCLNHITSNKLSGYDVLSYTGGIVQMIESKTVQIDDVLNYTNQHHKFNILHINCMQGNSITLEYLSSRITKEHAYAVDINGNYPLLIACVFESARQIEVLMQCNMYEKDIMTNNTVMNYIFTNNLLKYFIEYFDESNVLSLAKISNDDSFQVFANSSLFRYDMINIRHENSLNDLITMLIFKKPNYLQYLLESNSSNIMNVMNELFVKRKDLLRLSLIYGTKLTLLLVKSRYMSVEVLKNSNLLGKLITVNEIDTDFKSLFTHLIDNFITEELVTSELILYCIKNFNDCLDRLKTGDRYVFVGITEMLLNTNNVSSIVKLFETGCIDCQQLKGNIDLLSRIMHADKILLRIITSYEYLNSDIAEIITSGTFFHNLKYEIDDEKTWQSLLNNECITTEKLNNCNLLSHIKTYKQFAFLVANRKDFNHSLFFQGNFLELAVQNDEYEITEYLFRHDLFTKDEYDRLIASPIMFFVFSTSDTLINESQYHNKISMGIRLKKYNSNVSQQLIMHKYFDHKTLNLQFNDGNNLLQHMIISRFNTDLVSYVISNEKIMTQDIFQHINAHDNNCLILALRNNPHHVPTIINSKFFNKEMITQSVEDSMYDYFNEHLLLKHLELFESGDILYKQYEGGNTMVHMLVADRNDNLIEKLITSQNSDIFLLLNNSNTSPLHMLTSLPSINTEILLKILKQNSISKGNYYMLTNNGVNCISNILLHTDENNKYLLEESINQGILTVDDLYDYIDVIVKNVYVFDVLKAKGFDVQNVLNNSYFKLVKQRVSETDKSYAKLFDRNCLQMTDDESGKTLLYEIITTDQSLCHELIKLGTIDGDDVTPYLYEIVAYRPFVLKMLLDNITEVFTKEIVYTCMYESVQNAYESFEILLRSGLYTCEILNELSKDTETLGKILQLPTGIKHMFQHNLITEDILQKAVFRINDPKYFITIMNYETLYNVNNYSDKTILHKLASFSNGPITEYIKRANTNLLLKTDKDRKTFLDCLIDNEFTDDVCKVLAVLNSTVLLQLLKNQDNNNKNFIMKCCTEKSIHILNGIKIKLPADIIAQYDNNMKNTQMYLLQFETIIEYEMEYSTCISRDIFDDDAFTVAARYNPEGLKALILKYPDYEFYDNCFVISCRYCSQCVRTIINYVKKITPNRCYGVIEYENKTCYGNFLQIACRYNSASVFELVNSGIDLQKYIDEVYETPETKFNALKLAILYEPNALKHIVESSYCNKKLISDTDAMCKKSCCLIEALSKQIASYFILSKSKHVNKDNYEEVLSEYKELIPYMTDALEKLLKYKDVEANDHDKNLCTICFTNKNRIIFGPCNHKSCVTCAIRLYRCHQCRETITSRLIY